MFWPFNRKKKQVKKYQISEFSKRRVVNGKTQVYHDDSGEWIYWYLIMSIVFDGDSSCNDQSVCKIDLDSSSSDASHDRQSNDGLFTNSESTSLSSGGYSDYTSSSSSSDYTSSSSYGSGSSGSFD